MTEPNTTATTIAGNPAAIIVEPPPETGDDGKGGKAQLLAELAGERRARQTLEQQIAKITAAQSKQANALAQAFGITPEETSDVGKLAGEIATLRNEFAESKRENEETKRENLVLSVATAFGISSEEDLKLLRSVTDEAAMRALAQRIATPAQTGGVAVTVPGPRPDMTQGGKTAAQTPALNSDGLLESVKRAVGIN